MDTAASHSDLGELVFTHSGPEHDIGTLQRSVGIIQSEAALYTVQVNLPC